MKIKFITIIFIVLFTGMLIFADPNYDVPFDTPVKMNFNFSITSQYMVTYDDKVYLNAHPRSFIYSWKNNQLTVFEDNVSRFITNIDDKIMYLSWEKNKKSKYKLYSSGKIDAETLIYYFPDYHRMNYIILPDKFTFLSLNYKSTSYAEELERKITKFMEGWNTVKTLFKRTTNKPIEFSDDKNIFLLSNSTEVNLLDTISDKIIGTMKKVRRPLVPVYARFVNNQIGFAIQQEIGEVVFFDITGDDILTVAINGFEYIEHLWISPDFSRAIIEGGRGDKAKLLDFRSVGKYLAKKGHLFHSRKAMVIKKAPLIQFANYMAPELEKKVKLDEEVILIDRSSVKREYNKKYDYYYKIDADGKPGWIHGSVLKLLDIIEQKKDQKDDIVFEIKPLIKSFSPSSTLTEPKDKNAYHPVKAFDNNPKTMWMEAAKGPGIGEYLEIEFSQFITIDRIEIQPGCFLESYWKQNNRIRQLAIYLDKTKFIVNFKDIMKTQGVSLKKDITFTKAKFVINDVYKTTNWDDTAISDIWFKRDGKRIELGLGEYVGVLKK